MTAETSSTAPATILDRMLASGISEDRAREHLERGVVHVDSEVATDPSTPAPWPTSWVIAAQ